MKPTTTERWQYYRQRESNWWCVAAFDPDWTEGDMAIASALMEGRAWERIQTAGATLIELVEIEPELREARERRLMLGLVEDEEATEQ